MKKDTVFNKAIDSKIIKRAIERMNSTEEDIYHFDDWGEYCLGDYSYEIRIVKDDIFIVRLEENISDEDDDDTKDIRFQKIKCPDDNIDYFITALQNEQQGGVYRVDQQ